MSRYTFLLLLLLVGCGDDTAPEQTFDKTPVALQTRVAVEDLDHPWELVWGPDNFIWFTERGGRIGRANPETGEVTYIHTVADVWQRGESGLLGLALHPNFESTPHLFVAYTYEQSGARLERVVRFTYTGSSLTDRTTIIDGITANTIHDGCRLLIHENKLFITTGDAGESGIAQNTNDLNGKVLRVNLDGSVPSDNPFPGNPIWSYGHRNPQGLTIGINGMIYSSEHGPSDDDEVNRIEKGRNFGWPTVHGFCDNQVERTFCDDHNVVEPLAAYTPTLAVCGMAYYGKTLIPQWNNALLMMTLKEQQLMILNLSSDGLRIDSQTKAFDNEFGRLRAICVAPDGRVFFSTNDEGSDKIIEVRPQTLDRPKSNNEVVK